jgi:GNAT superfamily N-acetyltransferase
MRFTFLADQPDALTTIARWYFDQWGHRIAGSSVDRICARLQQALNRDRAPLLVLALEGEEIVGVAELKFREMEIYPELEYWLGGVYVPVAHRGRAIATRVIGRAVELARSFGIDKLHIQTERVDGGLYARLGWCPLTRVNYKGLDVLVMERSLADAT